MQRYRFDLKLKRKWQGILEIPAKLEFDYYLLSW